VLALLGLLIDVQGEVRRAELVGFLDGARKHREPLVASYAGYVRAQVDEARGEQASASAAYRAEGYLLDWQIVGPFDNAGRAGHAAVYPPETTQHAAAQTFVGKLPGEPLAWRRFVHAEAPRGAFINFADLLHPYEQATGYATVWIKTAQAGAGGAAPRRGRGVQGVARRSAGRGGRHVPHADAAAGGARAAADGRVAPAADQGRQRRGAVGVLRAAQRSARGAAARV
jgi:hypothetical protein